MKILFVSGLYPKECFNELRLNSKVPLQTSQDVFQWSLVDGLIKNHIEFECVSCPFLPAYPIRYKKRRTPKGFIRYEDEKIGSYLSYDNTIVVKQYSIYKLLQKHIKDWCEANKNISDLFILVYTTSSSYLGAALSVKENCPQVKVVNVVADLVDDAMNFEANRTFFKKIQYIIERRVVSNMYSYIDKYILLTKAMEEKIPDAKGKSMVMEGIYQYDDKNIFYEKDPYIKTLLYTGALENFSGVRDLVNAFTEIKNPNYRLIICGGGACEEYIRIKAKEDNRIIFQGTLPREDAIKLQRKVTALINPRRPNGGITKYSFPSKTMEYLASGTPMLGYRLEGIPIEYYDNYYVIEDLSLDGLKEAIIQVLDKNKVDLDAKAQKARLFILDNKNSKEQVKRIIDFIGSNG